jgi:calcineurin-like phosphoesterase family protein
MIWLTSDEHYYHHNMLMHRESSPQMEAHARKFRTTDEMHRHIKKRHNKVVGEDDVVYHLGDFAYGPGAKSWQQIAGLLSGLKGTHHLILGNHDHIKPFDYVEAGFVSVHTSLQLEDYLLIHDPAVAGVLTDLKVIHGHTHSLGLRLSDNTFSVCVEMHDYYPVRLEAIADDFYSRERG